MTFDGKEKRGWVLGDFCFGERFRSLGPALQLQRACLESLAQEPNAFTYDFPSQSMMAIYKRIGIAQSGSLVRWPSLLKRKAKLKRSLL